MLGIALVDDHPVFRLGVRYLIESQPGMRLIGEAETLREARTLVREEQPEVLLLDIVLKDGSGLELLEELKDLAPQTRTLVMSMLDELLYAERCVRAGAQGFLMKSEAPRNLITALQTVAQGDVYLGQSATRRVLRKLANGHGGYANPVEVLTNRELEVFQLLGSGQRTREIAGNLCISPKTVESHLAKLKRKLGAKNGAELLRIAMEWTRERGHIAS